MTSGNGVSPMWSEFFFMATWIRQILRLKKDIIHGNLLDPLNRPSNQA